MMKSIICELDKYDVIGFDLDGTLYDEFDFVRQVYKGVAEIMSSYIDENISDIRNKIYIEWLKVGSSGSVFQNVFKSFGIQDVNKDVIEICINAYRDFTFSLILSERTRIILDYLKKRQKILYLITDGNSELQRKKIESLGLYKWFSHIVISGDYGRDCQKPSRYMFDVLRRDIPQIMDSVYCGDRDVDLRFSVAVGVDFMRISNMNLI